YVVATAGYALLYTVAVLALGLLSFRRVEILLSRFCSRSRLEIGNWKFEIRVRNDCANWFINSTKA
ncbi:MAG: hypothetical protein KKD33_00630, partial [Verrucomicrobia bacterium]|nr:hypothetical protein [Verrucomicrobiota bacterium]